MKKGTSISVKLVRVFVLVSLSIFVINMAIFIVQNRAIERMRGSVWKITLFAVSYH